MKWYEKSQLIDCSFDKLKKELEDLGLFFVEVNKGMPGLFNVELVEEDNDYIEIKTNEGTMRRTNIVKDFQDDKIEIQFDEEYIAGKNITILSSYKHVFSKKDTSLIMELQIEEVKSKGVLGFLYKTFGKDNIGKAVLNAYKVYLERVGGYSK